MNLYIFVVTAGCQYSEFSEVIFFELDPILDLMRMGHAVLKASHLHEYR